MMESGVWKVRAGTIVLWAGLWCSNGIATVTSGEDSGEAKPVQGKAPGVLEKSETESRDWSVQVGAAYVTQRNIGEMFTKGPKASDGAAEGEIYSLTLSWVAHRFEVPLRGGLLKPQFEMYATWTLVDEAEQSLFPDYNAGVGFRWVDFPWDRWVDTSFFIGIGFSYSAHVFAIDRERHPGQERSHLKLDWPLQLTFAVPRWPEHQLVLFNDHQSGGRILDQGGVNSVGLGYRLEF
jgi:hypothetical protein